MTHGPGPLASCRNPCASSPRTLGLGRGVDLAGPGSLSPEPNFPSWPWAGGGGGVGVGPDATAQPCGRPGWPGGRLRCSLQRDKSRLKNVCGGSQGLEKCSQSLRWGEGGAGAEGWGLRGHLGGKAWPGIRWPAACGGRSGGVRAPLGGGAAECAHEWKCGSAAVLLRTWMYFPGGGRGSNACVALGAGDT